MSRATCSTQGSNQEEERQWEDVQSEKLLVPEWEVSRSCALFAGGSIRVPTRSDVYRLAISADGR